MEGYCLNCSVAARHEPGIIVVDDDTARRHGELQYTAANIERILPDAHTHIYLRFDVMLVQYRMEVGVGTCTCSRSHYITTHEVNNTQSEYSN